MREENGEERFREERCEEQRRVRAKRTEAKSENPIGMRSGKDLDTIQQIHLQYSSLSEANPCQFCGAHLFHEELSREKWCCGHGELYFPKPAPLTEEFYNNPEFARDVRKYNNMFAFSALGVTGGFQGPPGGYGTSMVKIQGRTYHRIFDLNWQNGGTNNSELYIDDGSMRKSAAKEKNLNTQIISEIQVFLEKVNPMCPVYKILGQHPCTLYAVAKGNCISTM